MKEIPSFAKFAAHAFADNGNMLGGILAEGTLLPMAGTRYKALTRFFVDFFKSPVHTYDQAIGAGIAAMILDNAGFVTAGKTFAAYVKTFSSYEANELYKAFVQRIESTKDDACGYMDIVALSDLAKLFSQNYVFNFDEVGTKLETIHPKPTWPVEELVMVRVLANWFDPLHINELMWWPVDPDNPDLYDLAHEVRTKSEERFKLELKAARESATKESK